LWREATAGVSAMAHLGSVERARLRAMTGRFLAQKAITPVGGLGLEAPMRVHIAAQICLPVLELGLDWYDDWHEVVVYPGAFVAEYEEVDEAGVVHRWPRELAGEAWGRGPLVLAWDEIEYPPEGGNVILHECAHKLDMRNGAANGFPPLHRDMSREQWTRTFSEAFERMRYRLAHHHATPIDPYGAESPAEFFAVLTEAFFETPAVLAAECPAVYGQLRRFYRQDPARRLP
jgi:Mlc titration factor MtfA (ptsG expression regulator)